MTNINYSNKFLDSRLNNLVDLFGETFKISIKGVFVLLLSYGLNNEVELGTFKYQTRGKEFRASTDPIYDTAIFSLISTYLKREGKIKDLSKILSDDNEIEILLNNLVNIASAAGVSLLNKELSSYKGVVTNRDKEYFMIDVLNTIFIHLRPVRPALDRGRHRPGPAYRPDRPCRTSGAGPTTLHHRRYRRPVRCRVARCLPGARLSHRAGAVLGTGGHHPR